MSGKETAAGGILVMAFAMYIAPFVLGAMIMVAVGIIVGVVLALALIAATAYGLYSGLKPSAPTQDRVIALMIVAMPLASAGIIYMIKTSHPTVPQPSGTGVLVVMFLFAWLIVSFIITIAGLMEYHDYGTMSPWLGVNMVTFVALISCAIGYWGAPVAK